MCVCISFLLVDICENLQNAHQSSLLVLLKQTRWRRKKVIHTTQVLVCINCSLLQSYQYPQCGSLSEVETHQLNKKKIYIWQPYHVTVCISKGDCQTGKTSAKSSHDNYCMSVRYVVRKWLILWLTECRESWSEHATLHHFLEKNKKYWELKCKKKTKKTINLALYTDT